MNSTHLEMKSFKSIQLALFKFVFLIHFNSKRILYVDLNFSKKKKIEVMIYHVHSDKMSFIEYSAKRSVQSILFLSRLFTSVETRYWSIELELIELIWIFKKIRHLVEFSKQSTIIYTDHETALSIVKQTSLTTFSTDKFNLRLVRASDYVQRFNLVIRHKSEKLHIVFDALSRHFTCKSAIKIFTNMIESEFDLLHASVHFIASLVQIDKAFRKRIIDEYALNSDWQKISSILNDVEQNQTKILFIRENDLIYRKKIYDTSFVSRRMCISASMIKKILSMTHNNEHFEFDRTYEKIISAWYIRNLIKHLKAYVKHCSQCKINQIKRHKSYESLQSILSSFISFHTLTIDFVLTLFKTHNEFNNIMSMICKFFKRITVVFEIDIWNASQWAIALFERLNMTDWDFSKVIISDRDRKFLFELWSILFAQLRVKLLYFTVYHSQTDDASKRTNQILKIAFKSLILTIDDSRDWSLLIEFLQREFNNVSTATDRFSNEMCYEFTFFTSFTLVKDTSNISFDYNELSQ